MSRPRTDTKQKTNSPFKRFRLKAKLSQEQLGQDIGVAVSTIRRWEKGQAEPTMTVAQMKKFCKAVKQNFDELPESLMPVPTTLLASNAGVEGKLITNSRLAKTLVQVRETSIFGS